MKVAYPVHITEPWHFSQSVKRIQSRELSDRAEGKRCPRCPTMPHQGTTSPKLSACKVYAQGHAAGPLRLSRAPDKAETMRFPCTRHVRPGGPWTPFAPLASLAFIANTITHRSSSLAGRYLLLDVFAATCEDKRTVKRWRRRRRSRWWWRWWWSRKEHLAPIPQSCKHETLDSHGGYSPGCIGWVIY